MRLEAREIIHYSEVYFLTRFVHFLPSGINNVVVLTLIFPFLKKRQVISFCTPAPHPPTSILLSDLDHYLNIWNNIWSTVKEHTVVLLYLKTPSFGLWISEKIIWPTGIFYELILLSWCNFSPWKELAELFLGIVEEQFALFVFLRQYLTHRYFILLWITT